LGTLFFGPFRRRISSRAIKTHSSQSPLFKRLEVGRRCREVFAAPGAASRWLGIDVGADYDSRPLQRSEWARGRHTKIEASWKGLSFEAQRVTDTEARDAIFIFGQ
jgi:hypothetical protein